MGSLLVHITHGPDSPTRAALGFLVAKTAAEQGHDVNIFCAGDAAFLMKDAVVEHTKGIGTGALSDTLPAVVEAGVSIFVSGGSSKTRGVAEDDLENKGAIFATPAKLVELTFAADRPTNLSYLAFGFDLLPNIKTKTQRARHAENRAVASLRPAQTAAAG